MSKTEQIERQEEQEVKPVEKTLNTKNFYIVTDKIKSFKMTFYKSDDKVVILSEDEKPESDYAFIGNIVYTIEIPGWGKKNMIKELASTPTLFGASLNPYSMNKLIIAYLLKGWSIEEKLEFEVDSSNYEMIKDLEKLIDSDIADYVFDGIIKLYNQIIA